MSSVLDNIFEEDLESLTKMIAELPLLERLTQLNKAMEAFKKSGNINFLNDALGENKIPGIPDKPTRKKKQILDSLENEENIIANIKQEKHSFDPVNSEKMSSVKIKQEPEEMPAPTKLPPKKRKLKAEPMDKPKRMTRSRKGTNDHEPGPVEAQTTKYSDVIPLNKTMTTIELNDSSEMESELPSSRSTRTKTIKAKKTERIDSEQKGSSEVEPEPQATRTTRTKTRLKAKQTDLIVNEKQVQLVNNTGTNEADNNESVYEDAASTFKSNDPTNFQDLHNSEEVAMNVTYVGSKKEVTNKKEKQIDNVESPKKRQITKPIFSPYGKATTKSKIEAFEKLTDKETKLPTTKSKPQTPLNSKFKPVSSSTTKISRNLSGTPSSSGLSVSALKASQAEFREREKRRQEKEKEALMKKEAMLQAAREERRKKMEEKQMKAKQHREQIEKEKLKQLEMQQEKKRLLAQKATDELHLKELKQREETEQLLKVSEKAAAEMKKLSDEKLRKKLPRYMLTKAPLLPTEDCYDSDDEAHGKNEINLPSWATERELRRQQQCMLLVGETIKNTFFCRTIHSPDLREIFEYIDPKKLKRTSSAIWRKPPRYTLLSMTQDIVFSEED